MCWCGREVETEVVLHVFLQSMCTYHIVIAVSVQLRACQEFAAGLGSQNVMAGHERNDFFSLAQKKG